MDTAMTPPGLCATCRHHERVPSGKGSVFHRCRLSDTDDRFPRYPRLPVLACDGHTRPDTGGDAGSGASKP